MSLLFSFFAALQHKSLLRTRPFTSSTCSRIVSSATMSTVPSNDVLFPNKTPPESPIPPQESVVEYFQQNGCVLLKQAVPSHLIAKIKSDMELHRKDLSPIADVTDRFVQDYCNFHRFKSYQEVSLHLAEVVSKLLNSKRVRVYQDQLLIKEKECGSRTHWHSDQPYYDLDGFQTCSVWIPVNPVPRKFALEFIAETHKNGPYLPRSYKDGEAKWWKEGTMREVPSDIEDRRFTEDTYPIRGWSLEPGDVVCHNFQELHGTYSGCSKEIDRAILSIRFIGDDCTVSHRDWKVPSSLANNRHQGKTFPVVWPPAEAHTISK